MLAVGSANLTLLAASLVCRLPLPLSAAPPGGPPFGPLSLQPRKLIWAVPFSNLQEMHHGKEALLWQSEL